MLVHIKEIIKKLKRELKISFSIVEEQPFPNSQDQIRTDSLQNIFNIRKPILSLWKRKFLFGIHFSINLALIPKCRG
jgi:hypothetical protein